MKIKNNIDKREYLINIYNTLSKNLQFDYEFTAILNTITKMYEFDVDLATDWTFDTFNKYGIKGLKEINCGFENNYKLLIDQLLDELDKHYKIDEIIFLICRKIKLYEIRFCLWNYLFGKDGRNRFKIYFDDLIHQRKYSYAFDMVKKILENQGNIPYEIFDATEFLNNIISDYTRNRKKINNQQLLDMLYAMVDLIPDEVGKVVLKSNFLEYL